MGNPQTSLITHNQRVIDQLALENLNNLKVEKFQREKSLVLDYLKRKLTRVAHLDDSTIDRMESSEFDLVLKKAKVRKYLILGFKFTLGFFIGLGVIASIIKGAVLIINNIGTLWTPIIVFSGPIILIILMALSCDKAYLD